MASRKKSADSTGQQRLVICVRAVGRKNGVVNIDFSFIRHWLGPCAQKRFAEAITKHAREYSAAQTTYAVRKVLRFWHTLCAERGWAAPNSRTCSESLALQISELRGEFYLSRARSGCAVTTITNEWSAFLRFLPILVACGAIGSVEARAAAFAAPSKRLVIADREAAANSVRRLSNAPKSLNSARDSFNDNLLEPVSIIDGSTDYLSRYQQRLGGAIGSILRCAVKDFEGFELARQVGLEMIRQTTKREIVNLSFQTPKSTTRKMWSQFISENPNESLRLALGIVVHEMQGAPQLRVETDRVTKRSKYADGSSACWDLVATYGKDDLLPYLGILSGRVAAVCLAILIIEHPVLNPTSLYRAKVERIGNGGSYITSDGLSGKPGTRLSVVKLRAGTEKSASLSPLSQRVLARVFEWSEPLRKRLRAEGRFEEANCLWIGIGLGGNEVKAFGESTLRRALANTEKSRNLGIGERAVANRKQVFMERHPELARWRRKISFKSLRMSSGVLKFLESDGDITEAARIFGHRDVDTTLGHYIPNALRIALFERQIRRHQNRLITQTEIDAGQLLRATDFSCIEDLHQFLSSNGASAGRVADPVVSVVGTTNDSGLIIYRDPDALAVAMLYGDLLENASAKFLDHPDARSGIAPRFWKDFIDRITAPLPAAMGDLTELVSAALARKGAIGNGVKLPEIW